MRPSPFHKGSGAGKASDSSDEVGCPTWIAQQEIWEMHQLELWDRVLIV